MTVMREVVVVDIAVIGSFSSALACAIALLQEKESEDLPHDIPPRTIALFGSVGESEFISRRNQNNNNKDGAANNKACVHLDPSSPQFQELHQLSSKLCRDIVSHGICPDRYILQSGYNNNNNNTGGGGGTNNTILYNDRFFFVGNNGQTEEQGAGVVTKVCRATLEKLLRSYLGNRVQWHLNLMLESLEEIPERGLVKLKFEKKKNPSKKKYAEDDYDDTNNNDDVSYYARLVVGVDGVKSVVRQELLQEDPPRDTGRKAWQGVVNRTKFRSRLRETGLARLYNLACSDNDDENDDGEKILLNILGPRNSLFCLEDEDEDHVAWTVNAAPAATTTRRSSESSSSSSCSANNGSSSTSPPSSSSAATAVLDALAGFPDIVELVVKELTDPQSIDQFGIYTREPVQSWMRGTTAAATTTAHSTNPSQRQRSSVTTSSRITLLGDAAHPMPSGPRFQVAVQDALTLAHCLSQQQPELVDLTNTSAVAEALFRYERERIAATTPLVLREQRIREQQQEEGFLHLLQAGWNDQLANYRDDAAAMEHAQEQEHEQPLLQWSGPRMMWLGLLW